MRYEILYNVDVEKWNKNLSKCEYSTFFQTGEFLSKKNSNRYPVFIYIYDNKENIQGQLGLMISKSKSGHSTKFLREFTKFASKIGGRGSWVGGPIIHSSDKLKRVEILKTIFLALDDVAQENKLMILDGYTPPQDFKIDYDYINQFSDNNYEKENFITLMSDLNDDLETLWKKVKKSAKNDVTKAKREKIEVKEICSEKDLIRYKSLTKKWAKTKGIELVHSEIVNEDWLYLKSGIQKFFLAYQHDEILAGLRVGSFNKIAYTHQVLNSYSKIGNVAGPLLTWHAIEWAKNNGIKIYDFSGGKAPPTEKKHMAQYLEQWESLFAYKKKWGGYEVPYYHFIKIFNKKRYKFFRLLSKPDMFLRNYKKRHFKKPQRSNK